MHYLASADRVATAKASIRHRFDEQRVLLRRAGCDEFGACGLASRCWHRSIAGPPRCCRGPKRHASGLLTLTA
jgi:hypothetical protein